MSGTRGWDRYWDGLRANQLIFRHEAEDLVERLGPSLAELRRGRVLDFGCGFGFVAARLAPQVGELWAWDQSPAMREETRRRLSGLPNARVAESAPPGGTPGAFDLILVNSVAQYLATPQLEGWVRAWGSQLVPGGRVILSDLIPRDHNASADMMRLLGFAARRGFLWNALAGGATEFARYFRMRRELPLSCHGEEDIRAMAAAAGLVTTFLPANLGYRSGRMTAVLQRNAEA